MRFLRTFRVVRNVWPVVWRALLVLSAAYTARAGGPRWVTGPPYFTVPPGNPVAFYTSDVTYFTDPGNLSVQVSHSAADAMVARAAAVWNVPMSRLTLAQGGELAEHLSAANVYIGSSGLQVPADVQPSNYRSKPVAVLYDTDGSVIDTLLGAGASAPASCRQNGVIENVDDLNPDGTIHHALLILNGRCATSTGDPLMQMQYQLARAFGRVLGVAWSQLNDDVFTGSPTPSAAEEQDWPLMHPIDVICGPYTYLCMQDPFRLRDDDIATLVWLYPITAQNVIAGKVDPTPTVHVMSGELDFATGQGMALVNVTLRRGQPYSAGTEKALILSAVTGVRAKEYAGNPLTVTPLDAVHSIGTPDLTWSGRFFFPYMPLDMIYGYDVFYLATESINPLYVDDYAIAPYIGEAPAMSGSTVQGVDPVDGPDARTSVSLQPMPDAAAVCAPGSDGTEAQPVVAAATGAWSGQLCGVGHSSWFSFTAKAGRSFTVETTALDEGGTATTHKAQIVLGVWLASDATHTLPTVAAQTSAFNAPATGVTALRIDAGSATRTLRFAVAEERGFGRPDFAYNARILYLDAVSPATLTSSGGTITITGAGFRNGNKVFVNGIAATVQSWTANTIVASAPTMAAAGASSGTAVAVSVIDAFTGGSSIATAALTYSGTDTYAITTASAPVYLAANAAASWTVSAAAFRNAVSASGISIAWSAGAGLALSAVSSTTGATGIASITVSTSGLTAGTTGSVTGCVSAGICTTAPGTSVAAAQWAVSAAAGAGQSVPATQTLAPVTLLVHDAAGHPLQSAPITVYQTVTAWTGTCPVHGRCPAAPVLASTQTLAVSDANGLALVTPLEVPAVASVVNIAAVTGTQGFVSLTLQKTPLRVYSTGREGSVGSAITRRRIAANPNPAM